MKLSMKMGDRTDVEDPATLDISVFLDGAYLRNCIVADTDEGYVITLGEPNKNGKQHEVKTYGRVRIIENGTERVIASGPSQPHGA